MNINPYVSYNDLEQCQSFRYSTFMPKSMETILFFYLENDNAEASEGNYLSRESMVSILFFIKVLNYNTLILSIII